MASASADSSVSSSLQEQLGSVQIPSLLFCSLKSASTHFSGLSRGSPHLFPFFPWGSQSYIIFCPTFEKQLFRIFCPGVFVFVFFLMFSTWGQLWISYSLLAKSRSLPSSKDFRIKKPRKPKRDCHQHEDYSSWRGGEDTSFSGSTLPWH